MLALLLCNANRVVSRERLIDELFGDHPDASAERSLRVQISRLHKALEGGGAEPRLPSRPPGYLLRFEDGELDLHEFEQPVAAGRQALAEGMPVSTATEAPGWRVTGHIGEVSGLVVRSCGAFPQNGANLKAVFGGELRTLTNLLRGTRKHAIARMVEEAEERGAERSSRWASTFTSMGETAG